MKRAVALLLICVFSAAVYSQRLVSPVINGQRVRDADLIKIVKAEDARNADPVNPLLRDANPAVRYRAALAAGRIGSESSLEGLQYMAIHEPSSFQNVDAAVFAIGEIESAKGIPLILRSLKSENDPVQRAKSYVGFAGVARLVEAAGKLAAANPKDPQAKELGEAILECLRFQVSLKLGRDVDVTRLALTAALRARPEGADVVVANFLNDSDPRIRADAMNTLSRIRAKNANFELRKILTSDPDGVARANAARALGAAEDKEAVQILISAATTDSDPRVRVSAIRSLGALKDPKAAEPLINQGAGLLSEYKASKDSHPTESAELIEIANALGRMLVGTKNERATKFLFDLAAADNGFSSEAIISRMKISPGSFNDKAKPILTWHQYSTIAQAMGAFAESEGGTPQGIKAKAEAPETLRGIVKAFNIQPFPMAEQFKLLAAPDFIQAFAAYKTSDLSEVMRESLGNSDVFVRAAAAGVLADQPVSKENSEALKKAFDRSMLTDKHDNDAQLAILDALAKLDKRGSVGTFTIALSSPDYLVRKKAFEILGDKDLQKDSPGLPIMLENARAKHKDQVMPYSPGLGTKLGQVLNTGADYVRALSRKNGSVKAVLTTTKGAFTIVFNPEDAPLTVDNFVKLARTGYFNGLEVHRVVPNFVMQDGDPRGDGNGGPGWSIRCEVNMLPYDRGAVGMALSGKDTGGSQWFVTHSPQPHLDGGYTVFGHVSEGDMKVVDKIVRGDRIVRVTIIGR